MKENYWSCDVASKKDSEKYPPGYDFEQCEKILSKAPPAIDEHIKKMSNQDVLGKLWNDINKIEVWQGTIGGKKTGKQTCYKSKLFDDNGWCLTGDKMEKGKPKTGEWGFCDTSCKLMADYAKNPLSVTPAKYHKMNWKVVSPVGCRTPHFPLPPSHFPKGWIVCEKTILPDTHTFQFTRNIVSGDLKYEAVRREKPLGKEGYLLGTEGHLKDKIGYQHTCAGDSGAGHWIFDEEKQKAALVGTVSWGQGLCGYSNHMITTTWPFILEWIKRHSGIRDCPEHQTKYSDKNNLNNGIKAENWKACGKACQKHPKCMYWSFNKVEPNRNCHLKTQTGSGEQLKTKNEADISGSRFCM